MDGYLRTLPTGEPLTPDERIVQSAAFRRSNLALWSRLELAVTNRRLAGREPHLFLGLVEVGSNSLTYPLPNIASVGVDTRVWIAGLLTAVFFARIGFGFAAAGAAFGWLILLLAIAFAFASFRARIMITNNGGSSIATGIAYMDRRAATEFARVVSGVLAELSTADRASSAAPATSSTDPRDALARVARLRDDGLISSDEYEAKKREILSRI